MDELRIQLPEARTLRVGRQRLVIRKPNVAWWTKMVRAAVRTGPGVAEGLPVEKQGMKAEVLSAIASGTGRKLRINVRDKEVQ